MQNRTCSAGEAGYVNLNGMWRCPRCGCANDGCDVCRDCGWNRCGCQGGVVWTAVQSSRAAYGCEAAGTTACDRDCDACPVNVSTGHRVQRCPENTRIRRENDSGCAVETSKCQNRSRNDCGCAQNCAGKSEYGCAAEIAQCQNRSRTGYGCVQDYAGKSEYGCAAENAKCQNRSRTGCGCVQDYANKSDCGGEGTNAAHHDHANARVGIVHAEKQELADVYESESALRTGTLFPELHKPMNGRCPACSNCSTCDQQTSFAAWDLRLYLNTHPEDQEALALFRRLCGETGEPNYATTFLQDGCGWNWTDDPWPWECQKCGD